MTDSKILKQLNKYKKDYDLTDIVKRIEDLLYDYELELGNIVCMFVYKKEDKLELSFLTCPNKHVKNIEIFKK